MFKPTQEERVVYQNCTLLKSVLPRIVRTMSPHEDMVLFYTYNPEGRITDIYTEDTLNQNHVKRFLTGEAQTSYLGALELAVSKSGMAHQYHSTDPKSPEQARQILDRTMAHVFNDRIIAWRSKDEQAK